MLGTELHRYRPDERYLCGDKEAEGLNIFIHRPFQVAYLIADSKQIYEQKSEYIWWADLKVTKGAAEVTVFDYKAYKEQAQPADQVLARYEERLFDTSLFILGHNFFYDAYMHANWRRALGKEPDFSWMDRLIDTHCLFKALKKGWIPDLKNYPVWQWKVQNWIERGLKSNVALACQEFGIEYDAKKAHRADYDIIKTREIWEVIKWKIEV